MRFSKMVPIILILLSIGLIFISLSSTSEAASTIGDKLYFIKKQALWTFLGLVGFFFASKLNLDFLKKYADYFFYFSILLLSLLLLPNLSSVTLGARRWLDFGMIGIQPSEVFKLSAIIFFSKLFSHNQNQNIKKLITFLSVPLLLIMLEPNLSTAILISAIVITIYYLSGSRFFPLVIFCTAMIIICVGLIFISPYRKNRLVANSYHSNQMILALASGHISGKGLANSEQKYRYLPKISTDSILAVIGEETGLIGCSVIIFLYTYLFLTILSVSRQTTDHFYHLLSLGVGCCVAYQSLINMSAVVGLIPLTGVPLPLISYGGSSLVTLLFGLGLVENIYHHTRDLVYSVNRENNQNNHHYRHPPHSRH
jgi:cell division protein FtsW